MPKEVEEAQAKSNNQPQTPAQPDFVAGGGQNYPAQRQRRDDYRPPDRGSDRPPSQFQSNQGDGYRPNFLPPTNDASYSSPEAAERAFTTMLSQNSVSSDWTWERAMKEVIKHAEYRAIGDPRKRKKAFEKWSSENAALEKEKAKEREAKAREDFKKMLRSHPEIKHYTRWKTIRPILEGEAVFKTTSDEAERRQFFYEYIATLQSANVEAEAEHRKSHLAEMNQLFKELDIGLLTTWDETKEMLGPHEGDTETGKYKSLHPFDVLSTFEQHMRSIEEGHNHVKQMEKLQEKRKERQNRDRCQDMLNELRDAGRITGTSQWVDILPLVEDDPRYDAMLGQEGSSTQDLFFDMLYEEKQVLQRKQQEVEDILAVSSIPHNSLHKHR